MPAVTSRPHTFSTRSTTTMSSTTPGMLRGSWVGGPTQATRSSLMRTPGLLVVSAPVQSRPMLVSSRAVIGPSRPGRNHEGWFLPSCGHLPSIFDVGADRANNGRLGPHAAVVDRFARHVLHIGSVTVLHRGGS